MRTLKTIIPCLLIVILSACGKADQAEPATQIAAKVNSDEISIYQINTMMSRVRNVNKEQAEQLSHLALEQLIDQQLLIQKAVESKLDRDPEIVTAIENGRRQILAQAYRERVMQGATPPEPDAIRKYYVEHPELFAERKLFRFQEIAAAVSDEQAVALRAQVSKTKNLNDIASWMKSQNIAFNGNLNMLSAERLPIDQLEQYQKLKIGEMIIVPAAGNVIVRQLIALQEVPLNEKEATPLINQFLSNRQRADAVASEIKQLRAAAKIEYIGAFANKPAIASPPPPSALPAESKAEPIEKASAANAAPNEDPAALDKGLQGLK